ncbi:MAG: EAL domain-containing protein [Acidimicrobiia bacterium]|nr:EAL domain-containing protein [Acidimicrobiia bacterium]
MDRGSGVPGTTPHDGWTNALASLVDLDVLDGLFAPLRSAVVVIDDSEVVVYASPAIEEILGYEPRSLIGHNVREFVDSHTTEATLDLVGFRSGAVRTGTRVQAVTADGRSQEVTVHSGQRELAGVDGLWILHVERPGGAVGQIDALRQRLAVEDLLTGIASSLVRRPMHDLDEGIVETLAVIGRHARVDRSYLLLVDDQTATLNLAHEWVAEGVTQRRTGQDTVGLGELGPWIDRLAAGDPVYVTATHQLRDDEEGGRAHMERGPAEALLAAPVLDDRHLLGAIVVESCTERVWADDHLTVLESAAGILAQALGRRTAEERVAAAFHRAPLGMAVVDPQGTHLEVNPHYCELVGRTPAELTGMSVTDLVARSDRTDMISRFRALLEGRVDRMVAEVTMVCSKGLERRVRAHCAAVGDDGELRQAVLHVEDISEQYARQQELEASEERYRTLIENSPAIVTRFDRRQRMIYMSPAFDRTNDASILTELFTSEFNVGRWENVLRRVMATGERDDGEWAVEIGGERRWFQSRAVPEFAPDGSVEHVLVMATDITALKRTEAELAHRALHDPLTGLANRTLLEETVNRLLRDEPPAHSVAVLFVDLDRFKVVNDSLGHHAGDHLITVVAARLQASVPASATIGRVGGDEFVVVLSGLADPGEPMRIAEMLRESLSVPVQLGTTAVTPTVSIGLALYGEPHDSAEALLRDADSAMYLAKARGRNRSEFCDDALRRQATDRLELEHQLRRSVDLGGLTVNYQPEFEIGADGVVAVLGAEALARWDHPTRGRLEAGRFIELAEETGIILELGRWVLMAACREAGRWRRAWPAQPLVLRVNLSPRQLVQPELADMVVQAVAQGGIEPSLLCLEITETALMDDPEAGGRVLAELHDLGVQLAIDDFGTGYSSLAQLKRFPVDVLKIDRSFVDGLGFDTEDTAIVEAIVSMSSALGLEVVAEGVELDVQLHELVRLGCHRAQGFGLAMPMAADDLMGCFQQYLQETPRSSTSEPVTVDLVAADEQASDGDRPHAGTSTDATAEISDHAEAAATASDPDVGR